MGIASIVNSAASSAAGSAARAMGAEVARGAGQAIVQSILGSNNGGNSSSTTWRGRSVCLWIRNALCLTGTIALVGSIFAIYQGDKNQNLLFGAALIASGITLCTGFCGLSSLISEKTASEKRRIEVEETLKRLNQGMGSIINDSINKRRTLEETKERFQNGEEMIQENLEETKQNMMKIVKEKDQIKKECDEYGQYLAEVEAGISVSDVSTAV